MAQPRASSTFTTLRIVTQRIATTPAQRLPHVVSYLATILGLSKDLSLAARSDSDTRNASEGAVLVHKLKTQISTLLQDRRPESQFSAVVLVKAAVEAGEWSILQGVSLWVKNLIGIVAKSNSAATQCLAVVTVARIFLLTQKYPSLVREITTPCIAEFINACLNVLKDGPTRTRSDVLCITIQTFIELLPQHPASFRPFSARIQALCVPLVAPTPSTVDLKDATFLPSSPVSEIAQRLYVLLSISAPKNASSEAWTKSFSAMIEYTHRTNDIVFRALVDDIKISLTNQNVIDHSHSEEVVQDCQVREPCLPPWMGISAGIERLHGLLQILGTFISTPSAVAVVVPLGELIGIIERILSTIPPTKDVVVRTRPDISREERETLFVALPFLHISAMDLCSLLLSRLGRDAAPVSIILLDQILWTLQHSTSDEGLRRAAYTTISQLIDLFGPSLQLSSAASLSSCIKLGCEDLLLPDATTLTGNDPLVTKEKKSTANIDPYMKAAKDQNKPSQPSTDTARAATTLLSSALTHLPTGFISSSLRQKIDRTAILTKSKDIMFASAMNPPTSLNKATRTSSLLPFLARSFPDQLEVEALIRPRMPPLQVQQVKDHGSDLDEDIVTAVEPDDIMINSGVHQHDIQAATDAKRPRPHSDGNPMDTDMDTNEMNHVTTNAPVLQEEEQHLPPSPKRQKLIHDIHDPIPITGSIDLASHKAIPQHPIEQTPKNDNKNNDTIMKPSADTHIGQYPPPAWETSNLTARTEIDTSLARSGNGNENFDHHEEGDSDSSEFVMPVLEMDSGFEDDEDEDEEEEEEEGEK